MKKILFAFMSSLLIISGLICNAQETEPEWSRILQLNTYGNQTGRVVTSDNEFTYIIGMIYGPVTFEGADFESTGFNDMILAKVSNSGITSWVRQVQVQNKGTIIPHAIYVDAYGNVYVSGLFSGYLTIGLNTIFSDEYINAFMAKFNSNGDGLWVTSFSSPGNGPSKIAVDEFGNSFLLSQGAKLLKFNNSGSVQWEQLYPNYTLHAVAIRGSELFLGGALQPGLTSFGTIELWSENDANNAFLIKGSLEGIYYDTIVAISASKLSTKEGIYSAYGTFNHPTAGPRIINLNKTLTGLQEDSLTTTVGDLTAASGYLILTIRPDDSVNISGLIYTESGQVVATPGLENRYDPVEGKFYLNYEYTLSGGTRYISEVLTKINSYTDFGSSIADIVINSEGNLVVVGSHTSTLTMNNLTIEKPVKSYYNFIGKCDDSFNFEWLYSSNTLTPVGGAYLYHYRVFIDDAGKIYEHGIIPNAFTFGPVNVAPNNGQFLLRFDPFGYPEESFTLQNTPINRLFVTSAGKIIRTGAYNYQGSPSFGNLFLTQYDNTMTEEWNKYSTNAQSGSPKIVYIRHDYFGNTYVEARILGSCNFFGTTISDNNGVTVNAKLDINGDLVWADIIPDLLPIQNAGTYFGPRLGLDNDDNLLAVGNFRDNLTIGDEVMTNLDATDDGYLVKYTPGGEIAWVVQLNSTGKCEIYGITSDADNNVVVSGVFTADMTILDHTINASGLNAAFLIKLDPNGNYIWAEGFPLEGTIYHSIPATDGNNNIYIGLDVADYENKTITFGSITAPKPELEATVLVKFDPDGNTQWVKTYGAVAGDPNSTSWPVDIKTDAEGNSFLWGWCQTNAVFGTTTLTNPLSNSMFYYIAKINTSGDVVWAKPLYERNYSFNYGDLLDLDYEGNVYVGGHFRDSMLIETQAFVPQGTNDFFVAKFNENGDFQWIKTLYAHSSSLINAISVFRNNILSICGYPGVSNLIGESEVINLGGVTCIIATLVGDMNILFAYPGEISLEAIANSSDTIHIISNTNWTAESNQEWLTLTPASGLGTEEDEIIITAAENTSVDDRYAVVTISATDVENQYIQVTQAGKEVRIEKMTHSSDFYVYPNPNNGRFRLVFDNIKGDLARITITNSIGTIISEFYVTNKSGRMNTEIDLGNVSKGFYFIQLQTGGTKIIRTFIVN